VFTQPVSYYASGPDIFGNALAASDLNADSHSDLIVGSNGSSEGVLGFFFSGTSAVSTVMDGELTGSVGFGSFVGEGVINGVPSLIVSEPGNGNGNVYVYH